MLVNLSVVAALFIQLTAIIVPRWGKGADGSYLGLWQACVKMGPVEACSHLPVDGVKNFPKNSLHAIRAFSIMSAVLLFFAILCMMDIGAKYKKCNISCLVLSAICAIISMIIWLAEFRNIPITDPQKQKVTPSLCFYLNILSAIIALGAAGYLKYY